MSDDEFLDKLKQACIPLQRSFGFRIIDEPKRPMYVGIQLRNNVLRLEAAMDGYIFYLLVGDALGISDMYQISIVRAYLLHEDDQKNMSLEESARFVEEYYPAIEDIFSKIKVRTTMHDIELLLDKMTRKRWPEQMRDVEPPQQ